MPKRTTRTIPRLRSTILRVTELERRDTPAWWSVAAPVPADGMPGLTDATHAGSLGFRPELTATNGTVRVSADTATLAVAKALAGTVTVTVYGRATESVFNASTFGTAVAEHKAFLAVPRGAAIDIRFEDLAGFPKSADWDYNDRNWEVRVTAAPATTAKGGFQASSAGAGGGTGTGDHNAGTGTAADPWIWDDLNTGETASVRLDVAAEGADKLRWTYTVHNDSLSYQLADQTPGMNRFFLNGADTSEVDDMTASIGWVPMNNGGSLAWQTPSPLAGPYLTIGQTAVFTFRTPPQPKAPGFGEVGMAGFPEWDSEQGKYVLLTLPALRPMGIVQVPGVVRVEITEWDGSPVGADGLKVGKWENGFDFVPTLNASGKQYQDPIDKNRVAGTAKIKGVDPTTGYDIIDRDKNRFNVWVYDKTEWDRNEPHIEVKISTDNVAGFTNYNDAAHDVDMVRYVGTQKGNGIAGEGWFWSDSQLLVSNDVDDIGAIPGVGADETGPGAIGPLKNGFMWKISDRTHKVALRGTVKAEYVFATGLPGKTDTESVPLKHFVNAHVTILNKPDPITGVESSTGVITVAEADLDFRRANEQYAQVGILLLPDYAANVAWPVGVDLKDGLDEFTKYIAAGKANAGKIDMTGEEVSLLTPAAEAPATGKIEVYYVNKLYNRVSGTSSRGEAFTAALSPSVGYADSVIISADFRATSPFTLAHETGHILTNEGHVTTGVWPVNLMRSGTSSTDILDASKRLTLAQDLLVNSARANLLK